MHTIQEEKNTLNLPMATNKWCHTSYLCNAIKYHEIIPPDINNCSNIKTFTKKYKAKLLQ